MACLTSYSSLPVLPAPATGQPRSEVEVRCLGIGSTMDQLRAVWQNRDGTTDCNAEFNRIVYSSPEGTRSFNPQGFQQVSDDMKYLHATLYSTTLDAQGKGRLRMGVPGQTGYDPFQETLLDACTNPNYQNAGICATAARDLCSKCSRNDLLPSTSLLRMCGCVVPAATLPTGDALPPECDPLCAPASVSKVPDSTTGRVKECQSEICVIDNVSITAARSTVGGINFTQVCPQCTGSNSCKCILDASIATNSAAVGVGDVSSFSQVCGQNSVCLNYDHASGELVEVPCNSVLTPPAAVVRAPIPGGIWLLVIIVLVVAILVTFAYRSYVREVMGQYGVS